jgi:hypothetical protein
LRLVSTQKEMLVSPRACRVGNFRIEAKLTMIVAAALALSGSQTEAFQIPEQTASFTVVSEDLSKSWNYEGTTLKHVTKVSVIFTDQKENKCIRFEDFLYDKGVALSCRLHNQFPLKPNQAVDINLRADSAGTIWEDYASANVAARLYLGCIAKKAQLFTIWLDASAKPTVLEEFARLGFVSHLPEEATTGIVPTIRLAVRGDKSLEAVNVLYFSSKKIEGPESMENRRNSMESSIK